MYCPNCSNRIRENVMFCGECGARLVGIGFDVSEDEVDEMQNPVTLSGDQQQTKSAQSKEVAGCKTMTKKPLIAGILLIICGIYWKFNL